MNFDSLIQTIAGLHDRFQAEALRAVNVGLTARNWMIGLYVKEYEQNGEDRAVYGSQLLGRLAVELADRLDRCYTERYLRLCRQLYETYPQIGKPLISETAALPIRKSAISESDPLPRGTTGLRETASPGLAIPADTLLDSLSFSHFVELLSLEAPLKRAFYEIECVRGGWSVRELKRQISSLYYERSGLSKDKAELSRLAERLSREGLPRGDERELRRYRQSYLAYPQIRDSVGPESAKRLSAHTIRGSANPESGLSGSLLLQRLSFTHFRYRLQRGNP